MITNSHFTEDFKKFSNEMIFKSKKRGPDDTHSVLLDNRIFIGNNRLQIIGDKITGRMPLKSTEADCWISFNGEIYNYQDLKKELEINGVRFKTNTDSEVILNSYLFWGEDFVIKLNGIFAFVIYDSSKNKIISARDRFGAKPLYLFKKHNLISISSDFSTNSEIASTVSSLTINKKALTALLHLRFVPGEMTIYEEINKIKPAEIIIIDTQSLVINRKQFWTPKLNIRNFDQSEFNNKLKNTILKTSKADVEYSILLSGGLDSSTVLAILSDESITPIQTFSCSFKNATKQKFNQKTVFNLTNDNIDESDFSIMASSKFKSKHTHFEIDSNLKIDSFYDLQIALGEPMTSPNAIGLYLLGKNISKYSDLKLSLCGTGADELLGGYQNLYFKDDQSLKSKDTNEILKAFINFDSGFINVNEYLNDDWIDSSYLTEYLENIMLPLDINIYPNEILNQLLIFEMGFALPFWELDQADKLFMHFSIELRPSFLENDFLDYCLSIASENKIKKQPLKNAIKIHLPKEIIEREKIPSLSTPSSVLENEWFKLLYTDLINNPHEIWNKQKIKNIQYDIKNGDNFDIIYRLIYIQSWLKNIHEKKYTQLKIVE